MSVLPVYVFTAPRIKVPPPEVEVVLLLINRSELPLMTPLTVSFPLPAADPFVAPIAEMKLMDLV